MTANVEGHQAPDGSGGESLVDIDKKLTDAREELLVLGNRFRSIPSEKYLKEFFVKAEEVDNIVLTLITHFINDVEIAAEEKVKVVCTLMHDCEQKRDMLLNKILGKETFASFNFVGEDFEEIVEEAITSGQYVDPAQFLHSAVQSANASDYEDFANEVLETKTAKYLEVAKKAGGFALDFVKIAGAVTVGALVANKISKK